MLTEGQQSFTTASVPSSRNTFMWLPTSMSPFQHLENPLDCVYTNKKMHAAVPHQAFSDHISIMLVSVYRPLLRRQALTQNGLVILFCKD